jgi:hypothetical protein
MSNLSGAIADAYVGCYRDLARRTRVLAEGLSEDEFWRKPYPYGNSFGNLVLHVTGNLSYYVGARIARSGYVRERDREFTDSRVARKDEVLGKLDEVVELVVRTLEAQTDASWEAAYEAVGLETVPTRFGAFLQCAAHFREHVGQMIYLVNELERSRADARADLSD